MAGRRAVGALLAVCAVLGAAILVDDVATGPPKRFLWADRDIGGPVSHAYALIAFIVIDLVLAGLVVAGKVGTRVALVWSVLVACAMALDPLTAPYYKTDPQTFANYLFTIPWFDALLGARALTAAASWRAMRA